MKKSLKSVIDPEFCFVNTRKPSVYNGGYAFQVEVGLAYGGNAGRLVSVNSSKVSKKKKEEAEEAKENGEKIRDVRVSEIIRFANKAPLLFDAGGCAITKTVSMMDWKRYGISNIDSAPISIFVNLISVHIPYTSAGKSAIADEEEILIDLKLALQDVARRLGRFIIDKKKEAEKKEKRKVFSRYSPYVVAALVHTVGGDPKVLQKNLDKMVLEKLKMDDLEDSKHSQKDNIHSQDEIEDDFASVSKEMEE